MEAKYTVMLTATARIITQFEAGDSSFLCRVPCLRRSLANFPGAAGSQGARGAHIGNMEATGHAAGRDPPPGK